MSRAERRATVERVNPVLPVSQQCRLLAVSRSHFHGEEHLAHAFRLCLGREFDDKQVGQAA